MLFLLMIPLSTRSMATRIARQLVESRFVSAKAV